jgi:PE family
MSFVVIPPESLAAASDVHTVNEAMVAHNAATPRTAAVPAAADEVCAFTAIQFAMHAQMYQHVGAQAAAVHQVFATTPAISAGSYAVTEAANAMATD